MKPGIDFIKHIWRYFRADVGEIWQKKLHQFYKEILFKNGENFSPKSARNFSLKFQA